MKLVNKNKILIQSLIQFAIVGVLVRAGISLFSIEFWLIVVLMVVYSRL